MANRRQPLPLTKFTGGINLRADRDNLAADEMPDAQNIEVDPRGPAVSREGWRRWNGADITADPWSPQTAYLFQRTFGAPTVMLVNDNKILHSTDGTFSKLQVSAVDVDVSADWHGADFANWADEVYIACGATDATPAHKWGGTGDAVPLTAGATASWNDDYVTPVEGVMPLAELTATHLNYLFVANTREDSVNHPNRIRWSHPNAPEDWASGDFIEILNAGKITQILSLTDRLVIFAELGIWELFGIDADSWQLQLVTRAVSTRSPNWVAESPAGVFFFSWPHGIHFYDGSNVVEVSESLRPAFDGGGFASTALDKVFLGWMNRRLWFGAPYDKRSVAADTTTVFVMDPSVGGGSWVRHVGADGFGVGPFVEDAVTSTPRFFACARSGPDLMRVDQFGQDVWTDDFGGVESTFESYLVTRWVNDGIADHKKSWKRASMIAREFDASHVITYQVFHDYDEKNVERSGSKTVSAGAESVRYGVANQYGDGSKYGLPAEGSQLLKLGSMGTAVSIQLKVSGTPGKPWGLTSITLKFIPRRYR